MSTMPARPGRSALFVNPSAERCAGFRQCCGEAFGRLLLAGTAVAAGAALAHEPFDLLVIDLAGHEPGELAALSHLLRLRHGAPVLVLCPYGRTAWLPELMAAGPFDYRISPILPHDLRQIVERALVPPLDAAAAAQQRLLDKERELRELLTVQRSLQRAIAGVDDIARMSAQICAALCNFPGVVHTALLHMKEFGNLQLVAQESRNHLDLARLLQRHDRLLESPLRDVFPPLLAVSAGELVLLDAPEKAGDPELAMSLHDRDVHTVLALPLRSEPGGPVLGAVSVMFNRALRLTREQFACFIGLAQSISFGLAMSELKQQNDALAGRLTQITMTDALTGAINRHAAERMLEGEIVRARRYGLPLAVIAFDIDNFRSVNDVYGYPIGDQALRTVAHTVQARLRASDTLARTRGEEFMIVATHTAAVDALKLAEKLREAIAGTPLPGCDTVTISLGVAQVAPEEGAATVIGRADAALHRAKRAGRNCVELAMAD